MHHVRVYKNFFCSTTMQHISQLSVSLFGQQAALISRGCVLDFSLAASQTNTTAQAQHNVVSVIMLAMPSNFMSPPSALDVRNLSACLKLKCISSRSDSDGPYLGDASETLLRCKQPMHCTSWNTTTTDCLCRLLLGEGREGTKGSLLHKVKACKTSSFKVNVDVQPVQFTQLPVVAGGGGGIIVDSCRLG